MRSWTELSQVLRVFLPTLDVYVYALNIFHGFPCAIILKNLMWCRLFLTINGH